MKASQRPDLVAGALRQSLDSFGYAYSLRQIEVATKISACVRRRHKSCLNQSYRNEVANHLCFLCFVNVTPLVEALTVKQRAFLRGSFYLYARRSCRISQD